MPAATRRTATPAMRAAYPQAEAAWATTLASNPALQAAQATLDAMYQVPGPACAALALDQAGSSLGAIAALALAGRGCGVGGTWVGFAQAQEQWLGQCGPVPTGATVAWVHGCSSPWGYPTGTVVATADRAFASPAFVQVQPPVRTDRQGNAVQAPAMWVPMPYVQVL